MPARETPLTRITSSTSTQPTRVPFVPFSTSMQSRHCVAFQMAAPPSNVARSPMASSCVPSLWSVATEYPGVAFWPSQSSAARSSSLIRSSKPISGAKR
ncbi:MAG: hypothetical protein V1934_02710 [Methanobacteriota archaeon]